MEGRMLQPLLLLLFCVSCSNLQTIGQFGESVLPSGNYGQPTAGTDSRVFLLLNAEVKANGTIYAFIVWVWTPAPIQFQMWRLVNRLNYTYELVYAYDAVYDNVSDFIPGRRSFRVTTGCSKVLEGDIMGITSYNNSMPVAYQFGTRGSLYSSTILRAQIKKGQNQNFDPLLFPFNYAAAVLVDSDTSYYEGKPEGECNTDLEIPPAPTVGPAVIKVGPPGPPGPQGEKGEPGNPGLVGSPGRQGFPGQTGLLGPEGPAGPAGLPGTPGIIGRPGDTGPSGLNGTSIVVGENGELLGLPGPPGSPGPAGRAGPAGPPGTPGASTGAQGPPGAPGLRGFPGPPGQRGYPGVSSSGGSIAGSPGAQGGGGGTQGPPGQIGAPGSPGAAGVPGLPGPRGALGPPGTPGSKGDKGDQGPQGERGARGFADTNNGGGSNNVPKIGAAASGSSGSCVCGAGLLHPNLILGLIIWCLLLTLLLIFLIILLTYQRKEKNREDVRRSQRDWAAAQSGREDEWKVYPPETGSSQ